MSESAIGDSFAVLTQFLVGDRTVEATLTEISELTVSSLDPVAFAGLTLVDGKGRRTAVFTDPSSPEIDQAQYDTGDGPCLEAFETGKVVGVPSTRADGPYVAFREAALAHGIESTLSLPLVATAEPLGAMNLYSTVERGFSPADRETAQQFARHAAVVLANAQAYWMAHDRTVQLTEAIEHRSIIEQAKGILMAAERCTSDEAFELLVAASQRENVKVRAIALRIVERAASDAKRTTSDGDGTASGDSAEAGPTAPSED